MAWLAGYYRLRSRVYFPRIQIDVSLLSGIHQICILAFPFDPPMQSDMYNCMLYKLKSGAHVYPHMLLPCHVIIITKLTVLSYFLFG